MLVLEVPKLGKEAVSKALQEWGLTKSKITHLIFCTTGGVNMPGVDWAVTKLLGLCPSMKRLMLYQQGCCAGGTIMRIAKDLAEINKGVRVLVMGCEITVITFRGRSETHLDGLVGQALFGDGARAMIIGSDPIRGRSETHLDGLVGQALFGDRARAIIIDSDPIPQVERPWSEVHYVASIVIPDSDGAIDGHLREAGLFFHLMKDILGIIAKNIVSVLKGAFEKVCGENAPAFNDLFWIVHPGGVTVLDEVEKKLELKPEKMAPMRLVLSEYGNVSNACVGFIMDHLRKKFVEKTCAMTGEGFKWGVLLGFGRGLTCETVRLKSGPLNE